VSRACPACDTCVNVSYVSCYPAFTPRGYSAPLSSMSIRAAINYFRTVLRDSDSGRTFFPKGGG
jgi:hypothetical protein